MKRLIVPLAVLVSLLACNLAGADEPTSKSSSPDNATSTSKPAKVNNTGFLTPTKAAPGQIRLIAYYSTQANNVAKYARSRQSFAKRATDRAQLPPAKGGLGMVTGFRDIEDEVNLQDFISNCEEGVAEAQAYLPLMRRGAIVLILRDGDEKLWKYGPTVLNDTMDEFIQISLMKAEHARLNPQHAQAETQPKPEAPSAVIASTNPGTPTSARANPSGDSSQK